MTNNYKFKRIFLIVMDSVGIGAMEDAEEFGDAGTNTLVHTAHVCDGLHIPNLNKLGIGNLAPIKGTDKVKHRQSYATIMHEASAGKDTMTGHWEMMGLLTTTPFKTFTDHGFPQILIDEIIEKTGYPVIGNYAASGTVIIDELGERHIKEKALIVYTSADSVLQIAAHEDVIPIEEQYRICEIVREITLRPEYRLGRVIARPFIGEKSGQFKRTPRRHDWALSPTGTTVLDTLKDNGLMTSCVGKISDIFNDAGVVKTQKTVSNSDGMDKTLDELINHQFTGLCFVNLVEFDSEYGHRRDPLGYGKALEQFDKELGMLLKKVTDQDLIIITADHGNDPTHTGTDHTREMVPLLIYNPKFTNGRVIKDRRTFADIGITILANFKLDKLPHQIGESIEEVFE
jgi:phosphopentomutase